MKPEVRIVTDDFRNRRASHQINDREVANWEARLASFLIERWGIVAATPDGEDSSGRAKVRALAPGELVEKACETATLAVQAFRDRGWVTLLPSFAELEEHERDSRDKD